VQGLLLQVTPGGRSWVLRYRFAGRRRNLGLGPADSVGLAQARELAAAARRSILAGIDPIDAKRGARDQAKVAAVKAMTFRDCASAYIEAHRAGWKNAKHVYQWNATLESYAYPTI